MSDELTPQEVDAIVQNFIFTTAPSLGYTIKTPYDDIPAEFFANHVNANKPKFAINNVLSYDVISALSAEFPIEPRYLRMIFYYVTDMTGMYPTTITQLIISLFEKRFGNVHTPVFLFAVRLTKNEMCLKFADKLEFQIYKPIFLKSVFTAWDNHIARKLQKSKPHSKRTTLIGKDIKKQNSSRITGRKPASVKPLCCKHKHAKTATKTPQKPHSSESRQTRQNTGLVSLMDNFTSGSKSDSSLPENEEEMDGDHVTSTSSYSGEATAQCSPEYELDIHF